MRRAQVSWTLATGVLAAALALGVERAAGWLGNWPAGVLAATVGGLLGAVPALLWLRRVQAPPATDQGRIEADLLLRAVGEGLFVCRADGALEWLNSGLARLVQGTPEGLAGRNLTELLPGLTGRLEETDPIEVEHSERCLEVTLGRSLSVSGLRLVGVVRDRSEVRRRRQEQAQAEQRERSRRQPQGLYLANVSHEIWTPMNGLLGMVRLLRATALDHEQSGYSRAIDDASQRLNQLLTDLLDHSKLEAGVLDCAEAPFDLRDLIDAQVKARLDTARVKQIRLSYRVEPLLPDFLVGSAPRLGQLLGYLIDNALKFTAQGEVVVNVQRRSDPEGPAQLQMSVSDTGPGIPEDQWEQVFRPFTQLDGQTTRQHGGLGLGLSVARSLAQRLGGRLWLESRAGRGSTFHCSVPLQVHDGSVDPLVETLANRLARQSVLLVSADTALVENLGEILAHWKIRTTVANSRPDAQAALNRQSFDILIADEGIPTLTGVPHTVMLVDSSAPLPARQPGVGYLGKPVSQAELWNALLPGSEAPESAAGISPLRILVVEDNPVNQNLAAMMLQGYGHQVKLAGQGLEALHFFQELAFDLILMDVQMPVMDGLEATRQIRQSEQRSGRRPTPILALTAHALQGDRERCLKAGMDGYLTKPLDENQLLKQIATVIPAERLRPPRSAAGPAPVVEEPAYDHKALLARVGGNPQNLARIVQLFLDNDSAQRQRLGSALERDEREVAQREVHTLKGMLLSLTAASAAALALRLEESVGQGLREESRVLYGQLEQSLDRLAGQLRAAVDQGKPAVQGRSGESSSSPAGSAVSQPQPTSSGSAAPSQAL